MMYDIGFSLCRPHNSTANPRPHTQHTLQLTVDLFICIIFKVDLTFDYIQDHKSIENFFLNVNCIFQFYLTFQLWPQHISPQLDQFFMLVKKVLVKRSACFPTAIHHDSSLSDPILLHHFSLVHSARKENLLFLEPFCTLLMFVRFSGKPTTSMSYQLLCTHGFVNLSKH